MNREDIVRMAREAGYNAQISNEHFGSICYISQDNPDSTLEKFSRLEHFAALVASAEREACVQMLEAASKTGTIISCTSAAKAIRARGQA
jgi:hypothetical protein